MKVQTCNIQLYKTHSDLSDSEFTTHEIDEFKEEADSKVGASCITQPPERNNFVLRKLATKKKVKYFVGLIQ
jgi:hypothetical protein